MQRETCKIKTSSVAKSKRSCQRSEITLKKGKIGELSHYEEAELSHYKEADVRCSLDSIKNLRKMSSIPSPEICESTYDHKRLFGKDLDMSLNKLIKTRRSISVNNTTGSSNDSNPFCNQGLNETQMSPITPISAWDSTYKAQFSGVQKLNRPRPCKLINDGTDCYVAYRNFGLD